MIRPMIIHTDEVTSNLVLAGKRLEKILTEPRPILWNRAGLYRWIPIERVRNAVRYYNDRVKITPFKSAVDIIFTGGDAVPIPQEVGAVIAKYNGHED